MATNPTNAVDIDDCVVILLAAFKDYAEGALNINQLDVEIRRVCQLNYNWGLSAGRSEKLNQELQKLRERIDALTP